MCNKLFLYLFGVIIFYLQVHLCTQYIMIDLRDLFVIESVTVYIKNIATLGLTLAKIIKVRQFTIFCYIL